MRDLLSECSIIDYREADYENLQLTTESPPPTGFFTYTVSCTGTVTSVRARGFCPAAGNGSNVVMVLFNSTLRDGVLHADSTELAAECNNASDPVVRSDVSYYEGNVSADNLSISVSAGDFLSVRFSQCSPSNRESCVFLPAVFTEPSNHTLGYYTDNLIKITPEVPVHSLAFSATIMKTDSKFIKLIHCCCN